MKIYTSFWTEALRVEGLFKEDITVIRFFMKKFVKQIKSIYGEVHLITDLKGLEYFNDIGFTSIDLHLESIPKDNISFWNYGKINSINYLAKRKEHFIHLDYDFIIFKKMPNYIESAEVVFQSLEKTNNNFYGKEYFVENCKNKYLAEKTDYTEKNTAYNCGIMGGANYYFFEKYTESSMKAINDLENKDFWLKLQDSCAYKIELNATKCMLAEQYYAALHCDEMNITPKFFWETYDYNPRDIIYFEDKKAIHFGGFCGFSKKKIVSMLEDSGLSDWLRRYEPKQ